MSRNNKRNFADYDEDPEDDDFDIKEDSSRKRTKRTTTSATSRSRPTSQKSKSRKYRGSDIDEDEDDISDDEIEDISDEEPSSPIEYHPATGKATRRKAARKSYTEPDSDEGLEEVVSTKEESEDDCDTRNTEQADRKSLIVTLGISSWKKMDRRGTRARTGSRDPESAPPTRRSSRITQSEDRLVALTDSGRHEREIRHGLPTPRYSERTGSRRPTQGGKGWDRKTSMVVEASQEDSGSSLRLAEPADEVEELPTIGEDPALAGRGGEEDDEEDVSVPGKHDGLIAESIHGEEEDDEDDEPIRTTAQRRSLRGSVAMAAQAEAEPEPEARRSSRRHDRSSRRQADLGEESDFEPQGDEPEDDAMSSASDHPPANTQDSDTSDVGRRSGRLRSQRRARVTEENTEAEDLAEDLADLKAANRERRKRKQSIDAITYEAPAKRRTRGEQRSYYVGPEMWAIGEDDDQPVTAAYPRGGRATGAYKSLWEVGGPFGFAGGSAPARTPGAGAGGGDSDSSDDDMISKPVGGLGGVAGMTPTSAQGPAIPFGAGDAAQGVPGGPANLGRITDRKALADADPLGVDQTVNFDGVGGLESHVNQLKEMVLLPLLYPELFLRLHVTPPRGVLFHGPPGTGKTLLARALANSVSSQGKRVTFYMRKGADTLSKYVGEAERQLRLLFEDARKNQPSIIFFDEIDGLAPVRSSKQDQIHATIVTTLLALMDGMDGRGQVIVIGATNRPDTVDSALRRPGRFDREFYFPLPNVEARRAIIDIHTKGWEPLLQPQFKDQLASLTNGYGGADLRALCTEAALNAIQGTYPQIYTSMDKLLVDPEAIKVLAKDFMISVKKIVPSSQRSTGSNAAPLDARIEPLLRLPLRDISNKLDKMLPQEKKLTALEEAAYDDREDGVGFERELMQQNFDQARVFRPRMLVYGKPGMGQHMIGSALLHKFERLHVQNFDLPALFSDSGRTPQAAIVQLLTEARRHKPSVIYIPNIALWYRTVEPSVVELFKSSLQALPPNEPILLLATMDLGEEEVSPHVNLLRDFFGFSQQSHFMLNQPVKEQRDEFFSKVFELIKKSPDEFPDMANRKKRVMPELQKAPPPPPPPPEELSRQLKALKKEDTKTLNSMKQKLDQVMDGLKKAYKAFRRPAIEPDLISYLYDERDPAKLASDVPAEEQGEGQRPYIIDQDRRGVPVIREVATGKIFYNLELVTVERRLSNGYYKRPVDFLADIERIAKDAKALGDPDKIIKANTMVTNVEVDTGHFRDFYPDLWNACEHVYWREQQRQRLRQERISRTQQHGQPGNDEVAQNETPNVPIHVSLTTTDTTGPIMLGQPVPGRPPVPGNFADQFRRTPLSNGVPSQIGHSRPPSNGVHDAGDVSDDDMIDVSDNEEDGSPAPAQQPSPETQPKPYSQRNFMTAMAQNSNSTNTSGNKSKVSGALTQQSSNGTGKLENPDLSIAISGSSEVPDTQASTGPHYEPPEGSPGVDPPFTQNRFSPEADQEHIPSTEAMPPPKMPLSQMRPHSGSPEVARPVASTPEANTSAAAVAAARRAANLILNPTRLETIKAEVIKRSSGFSVEQLEQMNATLMDTLWEWRSEWNRDVVAQKCQAAFNLMVDEIEALQELLKPSQETPQS